jgi:hypothetical protein
MRPYEIVAEAITSDEPGSPASRGILIGEVPINQNLTGARMDQRSIWP